MKYLITLLGVLFTALVNAQSLVSITPSTGAAGTTVNVTITGNGTSFNNTTRFSLVQGLTNVIQLTNVVASSATSVSASVVIPTNVNGGSYNLLAVVGLVGLPLQLANAFTITGGSRPSSIKSLDPAEGNQGEFLSITITGTNTKFSQSSNISGSLVKGIGSTIPFSAFAIDDSNAIASVFIPQNAEPGGYSIILNTGGSGGTLTKTNAFTVNEVNLGEIVGVTPNKGDKGDKLDITITGSGTSFKQGSGTVFVEFYYQNSFFSAFDVQILSDSTIKAKIEIPMSARIGDYDLSIFLGNGSLEAPNIFSVMGDPSKEPALKTISPNFGNPGQKLAITITGTNTNFTQSTSSLDMAIFSQTTFIEASSFNVLNDTVLIANFDIPKNFSVGTYDLGLISDDDGYLELLKVFSIVATNVKEIMNDLTNLFIFPNPAKSTVNFTISGLLKSVTVSDIAGKQISIPIEALTLQTGTIKTYSVNLDNYGIRKGIYFLKVETPDGTLFNKFIAE